MRGLIRCAAFMFSFDVRAIHAIQSCKVRAMSGFSTFLWFHSRRSVQMQNPAVGYTVNGSSEVSTGKLIQCLLSFLDSQRCTCIMVQHCLRISVHVEACSALHVLCMVFVNTDVVCSSSCATIDFGVHLQGIGGQCTPLCTRHSRVQPSSDLQRTLRRLRRLH